MKSKRFPPFEIHLVLQLQTPHFAHSIIVTQKTQDLVFYFRKI